MYTSDCIWNEERVRVEVFGTAVNMNNHVEHIVFNRFYLYVLKNYENLQLKQSKYFLKFCDRKAGKKKLQYFEIELSYEY